MPVCNGVREVGYNLYFSDKEPPPAGFSKKMYYCQVYKMHYVKGHGMNTDDGSLYRWANTHYHFQFQAECNKIAYLDDGTPVAIFRVWFKCRISASKYPSDIVLMCDGQLTEEQADSIMTKRIVEIPYVDCTSVFSYIDNCEDFHDHRHPPEIKRYKEWNYSC